MSDLFGGLVLLSAGTLYPAYSSYKAVKNKNTREYVKWMMYWIVFAFFLSITMFTDMFLSWFPGYYLFKTLFILWLVSPATRGSTYLYKKVVHPTLRRNEEKIDKSIENIKERGYDYTSQWARLAMQNFSRALMEAVFRGQVLIADQMQRQYIQQNNTGGQFPSGSGGSSGNVVTDGREVEHLSRSTSEGRLYRVDSQMFDMDDEFIDLSADVAGESKPKLRQRKPRGMRPVSMPVPTINEDEAYSDEAVHSDPDYRPDEARSQGRRSKSKQEQELKSTKRVTRSSSRKMDTIPDVSTDTPLSSEDIAPDSPNE